MLKIKIPLDINKLVTPLEVLMSILACQITEICKGWAIKVPDDLKPFVDQHDINAGYEWEAELLKQSEDMPIELLTSWVNKMPGGFFRAEMRAVLKNRISD